MESRVHLSFKTMQLFSLRLFCCPDVYALTQIVIASATFLNTKFPENRSLEIVFMTDIMAQSPAPTDFWKVQAFFKR